MIWLWATALAANPEPVPASPVPNVAEYERLTQELEVLASKNAWSGVERTFQELLATGVPPSAADWLRGAESARVVGDIGTVYLRVREARKVEPDNRMIVEWLYAMDQQFGQVVLACDLGSLIQLRCDAMPFDPEAQRAIRFAQQQIRDTCWFDGRLPEGNYRFYEKEIQVVPQVQTVRLDLRGLEIPRPIRKYLKEEWDKTLAAEAVTP
jgi:hypothetical protein